MARNLKMQISLLLVTLSPTVVNSLIQNPRVIHSIRTLKGCNSPNTAAFLSRSVHSPTSESPFGLSHGKSMSLHGSSSSSSAVATTKTNNIGNKLLNLMDEATNLFPLWVLTFSILGSLKPSLLTWFNPYITPALALTMMCMGMTLSIADFQRVFKTPQFVFVGFAAQYTIMPLAAALMARIFKLGPELSAGLILVGCAPGGTASNLVTMIAKADLALSVLMTAASTVAAVFMTPLLTSWLAGSFVTVKAADLVVSTMNVVLAPVVCGLAINTYASNVSRKVSRVTPFLSVLLVAAICGTISAANSGIKLGVSAAQLIGAIVGLHSIGFLVGYVFARLLGAGESRSRTISIETGMQNSALAVVLAKHFPNPALSSLPGAISATCHSVIGSLLAAVWRKSEPENN